MKERRLVYLVLLFAIFWKSFGFNVLRIQNVDMSEKVLSAAIVESVKQKDLRLSEVLDITLAATNYSQHRIQQEIVRDILQRRDVLRTYRVANYSLLREVESRAFNVFIVDSFKSFNDISNIIKDPVNSFDTGGYYLIAFSNVLKKPNNEFLRTFSKLYELYILKVIILYKRDGNNDIVDIYHYTPFSNLGCHRVFPELINSFENGKFRERVLQFGNALTDFHQCNFNLILLKYQPFVINEKLTDFSEMKGIDIYLLQLLMDRLNFGVYLQKLNGSYFARGNIYSNGTATGAMKQHLESGNITMGALQLRSERNAIMSPSLSYMSEEVVLGIPPPQSYTSFEVLFLPFDRITWILLVIVFAMIAVLEILIFKVGNIICGNFTSKNKPDSLLYVLNLWVGGSVSHIPRNFLLRLSLLNFLLTTLVLRALYQGSLFEFLQVRQYRPDLKTVAEFVDQGYDIYFQELYVNVTVELGFPKNRQKKIGLLSQRMDLFFNPNFRGVLLQYKTRLENYNSLSINRNKIRILPKNRTSFPLTIYFAKNSYLKEPIDKVIVNIMSSGLHSHMVQKYTKPATFDKFAGHSEISLEELMGAFLLCGSMHLISSVFFICELLSRRIQWLKNVIEYMTY